MNQSRIQETLNTAKTFFNNAEYNKALSLLNDIVEGNAADKTVLTDAYFFMANIFHIRGEIGKAIKAFNKVLAYDPAHTDAAISLSVLYNDIGHYEDAKKVFDKANDRVKNRPTEGIDDTHINHKFATKHYELAELYLTYNRYDEALFEYNKTISLDPTNLEARIKIAKVYAKKNFLSKAFDELKQLKNEYPNYIPARIALGVLHYGGGNILEAQAEWQKVLVKEPSNSEAAMYMNLSRTATETTLN